MPARISPKIILTVTQGRTGTKFLSHVLGHYPGVASFHEPEPNFGGQLPAFHEDRAFALEFLTREKIPVMQRFGDFPVYAETSHLWCQGPLQAWIDAGIRPFPDVIFLDRPLRAVSKSLVGLGTVPGRSKAGLKWCLDPLGECNLLRWSRTVEWTDYQLCFAYCLEIEERKNAISAAVVKAGKKLTRTSAKELSTWRGFLRLGKQLGLARPSLRCLYSYAFLKSNKHNAQKFAKQKLSFDDDQLGLEEKQVLRSAQRGRMSPDSFNRFLSRGLS